MELFAEREEAKSKSLLNLIRQYKETYVSDDEDSDQEEGSKDNPFLIQNALHQFVGNELYSDVVFIAENSKGEQERIPAHRMLLAARSPVFEAMLFPNSDLEHKSELPTEIELKDTKAEIFKLLLGAIYTDKPKILAKQVVDAVTCSRKYQVASLYTACQNYMSRGLSHENACELLLCAAPDDRKFAIRFIEENCEEVVQQDPNFVELPFEDVMFIVRSNKLCVCEIDLFRGVIKWGKAECKRQGLEDTKENLKTILEKIMPHIRFPLMSTNELAQIVSPAGVLDPDDLIAVFTYCSSPNVDAGTVGGFVTHPRQATFKGLRMRFDVKKSASTLIISSDGMTIRPKHQSCALGRIAITNVPYPNFAVHYFEVTLDHDMGCHDAVGVINGNNDFSSTSKLGTTKNSWAVRVYGSNTSNKDFYGAVHNTSNKDFYKMWKKGDRVGVKFDPKKKSLSYYCNGEFLGTPFTNVEGEIYPAIQICHIGSLVANFKAVAPRN